MIDGNAIAAQLKAQQDIMNANFQQEKESLMNALQQIGLVQRSYCTTHCIYNPIEECSKSCPCKQIHNILKGVLHEI